MKLIQTIYSYRALILSSLVVCGLFVLPEVVWGQGTADLSDYTVAGNAADAFSEGSVGIEGVLYFIIVGFFGSILGIAAWLLDFAVNTYIIGFGDNWLNGGFGEAVDLLWVTVRDFFNVMFIFGLVYIGFKMILNSDDSSTKRNLVMLIMAALLINFSLFITKFVVDFSNILASEIALAGFPEINEENGVSTVVDGRVDVANKFFGYMGIASSLNADSDVLTGQSSKWLFIFGNAMIYVVGAFAFGVGAFMIILRFAILNIYMVLSPFMFVGWVFPGLNNISRKYWSGFIKQAFYAPVYMIMIYFAGAVLSRMFGPGGSMSQTTLESNSGTAEGFAAILGPFILSATFMIAAVQIAGKLSADGSGAAAKLGGMVQGRVRGAVRGGVRAGTYLPRKGSGYVARGAANRAGNFANAKLDAWQASDNKIKRAISGTLTVDDAVRGTATKLKGTKAGLAYTVDERDKKQTAIKARQTNTTDIDSGINASKATENTIDPDKIYDPKTGDIVEKEDLKKRSAVDFAAAEKAQKDREAAKAKMLSKIRNLSIPALENMFANQPDRFEAIIGYLPDDKIEKLFESENLNAENKDFLFAKRKDALINSFTENGIKVQSEFAKLSIKQIEMLGDEFIRENADLLSQDQLDAIKKSEKFTPTQKDAYKGARKNKIKDTLATGAKEDIGSLIYANTGTVKVTSGSGKQKWIKRLNPDKFKKPAEIASLPVEALVNKELIGKLPVDAIKQIGRDYAGGKSHLSASEIDELYEKLSATSGGGKGLGNTKVQEYLKTARAQRDFKDAR